MLTCPQCSTEAPDDARFCGACGHDMSIPADLGAPGVAPTTTASSPSRKTVLAVAMGALVAIGAFIGALLWSGGSSFTTSMQITVLGSGCTDDSYDDVGQLVVKEPDGDEIAFADLAITKDGDGSYCVRSGEVEIDSEADYFLISSRSSLRSPIRETRAEMEKGVELSVGDCEMDTACLGWLLAQAED